MANRRIRFNVRESTAIDPQWEVEKAVYLWERMLASRLRQLIGHNAKSEQPQGTRG